MQVCLSLSQFTYLLPVLMLCFKIVHRQQLRSHFNNPRGHFEIISIDALSLSSFVDDIETTFSILKHHTARLLILVGGMLSEPYLFQPAKQTFVLFINFLNIGSQPRVTRLLKHVLNWLMVVVGCSTRWPWNWWFLRETWLHSLLNLWISDFV